MTIFDHEPVLDIGSSQALDESNACLRDTQAEVDSTEFLRQSHSGTTQTLWLEVTRAKPDTF